MGKQPLKEFTPDLVTHLSDAAGPTSEVPQLLQETHCRPPKLHYEHPTTCNDLDVLLVHQRTAH